MQRFTKENDDDIVTPTTIRTEFTFDGGMTGLSKLLSNDPHNNNNDNEYDEAYHNLTTDINNISDIIEPKSSHRNLAAHHHRKGTESTMSSSPPVEIDESNSSHHHNSHHHFHSVIQESGGGVGAGAGGMFFTSSASLSPNPQSLEKLPNDSKEVINLSSTLNSSHKSPIGKLQRQNSQSNTQHGNNHPTITSSPSLSLTPNSTDGTNFIMSPSGFPGSNDTGPSMPFLYSGNTNTTAAFQSHLDGSGSVTGSVIHHPQQQSHPHHHRRGESSSFGSFDLSHGPLTAMGNSDGEDDDNDGLFGLDALHYRASVVGSKTTTASDATPALISSATSSPRIARRQTYHSNDPNSSSGSQPRRASTHGERPPLSSQYLYADSSTATVIGSYGSNSDRPIAGSVGSGEASPPISTVTGFGAIGQLRLNAAEFDPNRRRSSSDYNSSTSFGYLPPSQPQPPPSDIAQKFGTLPTLSSHIQSQHQLLQQSMNNGDNVGGTFADLSKPRHTRSISQPIPPGMVNSGINNTISSGLTHDPQRYYGASSSSYDGKSNNPGYNSRGSLTQPQSHFQGGISYDKLSVSNFAHGQLSDGYSTSPAYSSLEKGFDNFNINNESHSNNGNFIGAYTGDGSYGRSGRNSSSSSPGPSQNQYVYNDGSSVGGNPYQHVRHQSDNGMMMNSSQSLPLGLSSGLPRFDDDSNHALAGENIDVPDHDDAHALPSYYASSGGSHPLLRGATHSHSMSLDGIQTQQFLQSPVPSVVYAVKFKRSQRNFILGPRINRDLKIGTYVKVEADRGEDLGIVVGKLPPEKFTNNFSSRSSFTAGMGPSAVGSSLADLKRIMRLATHDEVSLLGLKREEEEELLQICRSKVRQRGLRMNVIDAEYQFDRHKLTFFFEAMGRVDFRELVRDLFSMYKTRIWMQQLDKNTSTSAQAMIYPTANLQMDYGTPIIAPTSEFADSIMYGQSQTNISYGGTDFDRSN